MLCLRKQFNHSTQILFILYVRAERPSTNTSKKYGNNFILSLSIFIDVITTIHLIKTNIIADEKKVEKSVTLIHIEDRTM